MDNELLRRFINCIEAAELLAGYNLKHYTDPMGLKVSNDLLESVKELKNFLKVSTMNFKK